MICAKCGGDKALSDFYRRHDSSTGLDYWCKSCHKEYSHARYQTHKPELLAQMAQRRANNPGIRGRDLKKYWAKYPERLTCFYAYQAALHRGDLVRQPCERCHTTKNVHGHHADYSKPLEVTWLCVRCHGLTRRTKDEPLVVAEIALRQLPLFELSVTHAASVTTEVASRSAT